MSEQSEVVRPILDALRSMGICAWRNQSGKVRVRGGFMMLAPKGTPDIVGFLRDGRFLGIECKLPDGKHQETQEQREFGRVLANSGGVYILARTVDEVFVGLRRACG